MKTVLLKTDTREETNLSTRGLIRAALEYRTEAGFTVDGMRKRFKILDKLECLPKDSTSLELEDADYEFLVTTVKAVHWLVLDKAIIDFEDSLQ